MNANEQMPIEHFGRYLLASQDLDPVYVMLHKAQLPADQLAKWCVAYWCCYHVGVASEAAGREDGPEFWKFLMDVATNRTKRYPRGTERRHFRGENAIRLVRDLDSTYEKATDFVGYVAAPNFTEVARRVQRHHGFGPWIAFKVADMLERVLGKPVSFEDCYLGVYKEPVAGAVRACKMWYVGGGTWSNQECLRYAINRLMETFGDEPAPPGGGRCVNVQEIETILCKWKSHMNGHYPPGKDTHEIKEALKTWWSPIGCRLAQYLPQEAEIG